MGKKKTSTKNPSTPTNDHTDQADQASISTDSSDAASVPLDRAPPSTFSTEMFPRADDPAGFQQKVYEYFDNTAIRFDHITTRLSTIGSRLSKLECSNLKEFTSNLLSDQDSDQPSTLRSSESTPLYFSDFMSGTQFFSHSCRSVEKAEGGARSK